VERFAYDRCAQNEWFTFVYVCSAGSHSSECFHKALSLVSGHTTFCLLPLSTLLLRFVQRNDKFVSTQLFILIKARQDREAVTIEFDIANRNCWSERVIYSMLTDIVEWRAITRVDRSF
jgi:hypothetical protein